jgi:hypothetical protein
MVFFQAWLVAAGKARTVTTDYFQVGHTHGLVDQRFSIVASKLSSAAVLETPADFITRIQDTVVPTGFRSLHVEQVDAVYDWDKYFSPLGLHISGLCSTHLDRDMRPISTQHHVAETMRGRGSDKPWIGGYG